MKKNGQCLSFDITNEINFILITQNKEDQISLDNKEDQIPKISCLEKDSPKTPI